MRLKPLTAPLFVLGLFALGLGAESRAEAPAEAPTVFAAASLKTALDAIATAYGAEGHAAPVISYGGSSALAKQIVAGAPADLFISASQDWMDELAKAGALAEGTRKDLLGNRLVLVGHAEGEVALETLDATLGEAHLAMALVDAVPAGQYGKEAFETLGLWAALEGNVAQADNVRAALALVATGEAPFGVVYATDAVAEPRVHVAATFPEASHAPITYPVALLAEAPHATAGADFLTYLGGETAKAIFQSQGFAVK